MQLAQSKERPPRRPERLAGEPAGAEPRRFSVEAKNPCAAVKPLTEDTVLASVTANIQVTAENFVQVVEGLWQAQSAVYGNRRRVRDARGQRLMRRRGEYVERTFAHLYDTGGLRRTHLRGHQNILKRLLVHAGAFNLGLLMRKAFGRGTPRGLQGRRLTLDALAVAVVMLVDRVWTAAPRLVLIARSMPYVLPTSSTVVRAC